MPKSHAATRFANRPLAIAHRTAWVVWVLAASLARLAAGRLTGRPAQGHLVLRDSLERLGGSFVKFGQILSLQIDILPRLYCDTLLTLLDRVPAVEPSAVQHVLETELGGAVADFFAEFSFEPIASASIGQVHRARLADGTAVAVKVQRPGIREAFEIDNRILDFGVRMIFFLRLRRLYFMRDPVWELKKWTADETDYRREALNCQRLAANAAGSRTERLPRVFWRLTTTCVLTLEFLPGPSVATYLRMREEGDEAGLAILREQGWDPARFGANVIGNFLSDAFRHGAFHADLHPANLLILPGNVVGYVDFGIVATLTAEARRKQINLTLAYSSGDPRAIYEGFVNICTVGPGSDLPGLRRRIEVLAEAWYDEYSLAGQARFRVSVTRTMMDLLSLCQDYHVLVDREMIKYIRATILADGLISRLAPEVDLAQILRTVVEDYLAAEASSRTLSTRSALTLLTDALLWTSAGPAPLLQVLGLLDRGELPLHASLKQAPGGVARTAAQLPRIAAAGLVWLALVLLLGAAGAAGLAGQTAWAARIGVGLILAGWTIWLARLVRAPWLGTARTQ